MTGAVEIAPLTIVVVRERVRHEYAITYGR